MKEYPLFPKREDNGKESISYDEFLARNKIRGVFRTEKEDELYVQGGLTQTTIRVRMIIHERFMAAFFRESPIEFRWQVQANVGGNCYMVLKTCLSKEEALETMAAVAEALQDKEVKEDGKTA